MPTTWTPDIDRIEADLAELGTIGAMADGGMARFAWSDEEFAAKDFVARRLEAVGIASGLDEAANLWAETGPASGPALVIGSHLDTVPSGGRYDGALGVMAALEVMRLLALSGQTLRRRVRLVAFTDEEGARFGTGLFGSTAVAGLADIEHLAQVRDANGVALAEAMAARGRPFEDLPKAQTRLRDVAAYLELHIEQGPRLERMGRDVGIVTAITGIDQRRYTFEGEANHAGTTALEDRRDALLAAAETIVAVRRAALETEGRAVATVGQVGVHPGAANVVPGRASLSVEVRSPEAMRMDEVHARVADSADAAADGRVAVRREKGHRVEPAAMDATWRERLRAHSAALGEQAADLVSWAGHDAQAMATRVPAAMVFVPSWGGLSHTPREFTAPERYRAGVTVFARTIADWALGRDGQ